MKTLILYYSYSGHTKALAEKLAAEQEADLFEIRDKKRPGMLSVMLLGCPAAMSQKQAKIEALPENMAEYDKIIIMGPIWAGFPAPPVNNAIAALPPGKTVELRMVSSGGETKGREKVIELVKARYCDEVSFVDIKATE